jgi:hypothetical protein
MQKVLKVRYETVGTVQITVLVIEMNQSFMIFGRIFHNFLSSCCKIEFVQMWYKPLSRSPSVGGFGFGFLLQIVLFMNRIAEICIGVFIRIDEARCVVHIVRSEHQSRKKTEC